MFDRFLDTQQEAVEGAELSKTYYSTQVIGQLLVIPGPVLRGWLWFPVLYGVSEKYKERWATHACHCILEPDECYVTMC